MAAINSTISELGAEVFGFLNPSFYFLRFIMLTFFVQYFGIELQKIHNFAIRHLQHIDGNIKSPGEGLLRSAIIARKLAAFSLAIESQHQILCTGRASAR